MKLNCLIILSICLFGCSSTSVEQETAKAQQLKSESPQKFFNELVKRAHRYYSAAIFAHSTKAKPEGEKAFLSKIENEILSAFPRKSHEKIRQALKKNYIDTSNNISQQIANISDGDVDVHEIMKQNEYMFEKKFLKSQKEFRGFAQVSNP